MPQNLKLRNSSRGHGTPALEMSSSRADLALLGFISQEKPADFCLNF